MIKMSCQTNYVDSHACGAVSFNSVSGGLVLLVDPPACTCQRDSFSSDTRPTLQEAHADKPDRGARKYDCIPNIHTHSAKHSFTAHMIMLSDQAVPNPNMHPT